MEYFSDIIIKINSVAFELAYFPAISQGSFFACKETPKGRVLSFINDIDCQGWDIQYACSCKIKEIERIKHERKHNKLPAGN